MSTASAANRRLGPNDQDAPVSGDFRGGLDRARPAFTSTAGAGAERNRRPVGRADSVRAARRRGEGDWLRLARAWPGRDSVACGRGVRRDRSLERGDERRRPCDARARRPRGGSGAAQARQRSLGRSGSGLREGAAGHPGRLRHLRLPTVGRADDPSAHRVRRRPEVRHDDARRGVRLGRARGSLSRPELPYPRHEDLAGELDDPAGALRRADLRP